MASGVEQAANVKQLSALLWCLITQSLQNFSPRNKEALIAALFFAVAQLLYFNVEARHFFLESGMLELAHRVVAASRDSRSKDIRGSFHPSIALYFLFSSLPDIITLSPDVYRHFIRHDDASLYLKWEGPPPEQSFDGWNLREPSATRRGFRESVELLKGASFDMVEKSRAIDAYRSIPPWGEPQIVVWQLCTQARERMETLHHADLARHGFRVD